MGLQRPQAVRGRSQRDLRRWSIASAMACQTWVTKFRPMTSSAVRLYGDASFALFETLHSDVTTDLELQLTRAPVTHTP